MGAVWSRWSRHPYEEALLARCAALEAENASLRSAARLNAGLRRAVVSLGGLPAEGRPRLPSWDWEFRVPSDVLILCLSRVNYDDLRAVRCCCSRWPSRFDRMAL